MTGAIVVSAAVGPGVASGVVTGGAVAGIGATGAVVATGSGQNASEAGVRAACNNKEKQQTRTG